MKLILGTFLFSVGSALIPVLNVEIYLAALPNVENRAFEFAVVAGVGQTIGKILWFYAGIHSMKVPWLKRKMETRKWQASYQKWHQRIVGRPVLAGTIVFVSAFSGFPPLAIIAVLAGSLRMNLPLFIATTVIGRILRFWLVLEGASWVKDLVPHVF